MVGIRAIAYRGAEISGRQIAQAARRALPVVLLACVIALSSLTTTRPGAAPTQRNWVFGRLSRDNSFGQTFVAGRGELVGLRVLLFAGPTKREDPVTLRLRYADGAPPDLAAVSLPLRELARRDMTAFTFAALTLNLTATLRLDIEAPTLGPADWVAVIAGPDTYNGGQLLDNGVARPAVDLAFQPLYRQRWLDFVLPVSRMAQGRPGLLGWPQLYALLAYAYCLALMRALLWCWRVARGSIDAD